MARFISLKSLEMSDTICYQQDMEKMFDRFVHECLGESVLDARIFLQNFFEDVGVEYTNDDDELVLKILNKTSLSRKMSSIDDYGVMYIAELAFLDANEIKLISIPQDDIIAELKNQGANLLITQRTQSEEILQALSRKRRLRSMENGREAKRARTQE